MIDSTRYTIPAGSHVWIRLVEWGYWKPYTTKRELHLERCSYENGNKKIFQCGNYQMRIH